MKKILKKILPKECISFGKVIVNSFHLLPEYNYWFWRDLINSSLIQNEESALFSLLVTSHVLEKGITMPKRRLGFGIERVRAVIKRCTQCIHLYSENHIEIQSALKDLEQYLQLHEESNFELPSDISASIRELLRYKHYDTVPCFESTPDELFRETTDFVEFALSRHTCRWYSEEDVDKETLVRAIALAQTAPSACNRQATRVYIIESEEKKKQVLRMQNGNRGFGHLANKIILVTSDMKGWSYKYRQMAHFDAGIFTMNLLYALHYHKICACTLNANLSIRQRQKLQEIVGFTDSEIPAVFIAIGKAPERFMIAGSQRVKTEQIYKFV